MSIDSCQETEAWQCIAFPQREKESKRSTLQGDVKVNGRIKDPTEHRQVGFFALLLIWFYYLKKETE